jgi:hypothetical protein
MLSRKGPLHPLPLGLWDLPHFLGDHCDVVVADVLQKLLDSLLLTQLKQSLRGLKVGVAGEQDVVT